MAVMTAAANTGTTEMTIISSIVQDSLVRAAMLRPTVIDRSDLAAKGIKSIDLPKYTSNFSGPAAQNVDGATESTPQTVVLAVDSIDLDDWTSITYQIPDRVSEQSRVNLEAELAAEAGKSYGNYLDDQILVQLKSASSSSPDHEVGLGSDTQGVGSAIVLADIAKFRRLLNRANADQGDRFLVIPPEMEETIINLDNFSNADKYGSREALLNGEVGRIYGFKVLVHNALAANECVAYQKKAVAIAVQQEVKFETRRLSLNLQSTEYSFAMGMGQIVLQGGVLNIHAVGA